VVHQSLQRWLGDETGPEPAGPDPLEEVVRRYLRAFGPAAPADVTTWSGITGLGPTFARMRDELTTYRDEAGRELFDLAGLPLAPEDTPAPVRLLGRYDNVWLAHRARDRVTSPERRKRWMGSNGGVGATVFVDGQLEGIWRETPSHGVDVELFRSLAVVEQEELDREVADLEAFLAG
jgi:hypothetical protein